MGRPIPNLDNVVGAPAYGTNTDGTKLYESLIKRLTGQAIALPNAAPTQAPVTGPVTLPSAQTVQIQDLPGIDLRLRNNVQAQTDARLWSLLQQAVKETGVPVKVTSATRSTADQVRIYGDSRYSRHNDSNAIDFFPQSGSMADADILDAWFRGLKNPVFSDDVERGAGSSFSILWRTKGHYDHIHISVRD